VGRLPPPRLSARAMWALRLGRRVAVWPGRRRPGRGRRGAGEHVEVDDASSRGCARI